MRGPRRRCYRPAAFSVRLSSARAHWQNGSTRRRATAGYGWTLAEPAFDWATLIANKDREIARLEAAYTTNLERAKVAIVKSRAVLEDAHTVRLVATGETVRARDILIATGGRALLGAEIAGHRARHLVERGVPSEGTPKRILIQGGGYIAVEFAGIFNGLGSEVTLVYRGENILRGFDDDVREHLRAEMDKRGIKIVTRQTVEGIEKVEHGLGVELSDREDFVVDKVMFATGRRPNVTGLGLEAAGVTLERKARSRSTSFRGPRCRNIYAVGDVTDRVNLTPVAIREGHAFADTVFGGRPTAVDHADVPTAVFSEPECGVIGLTETQACERFPRVDIYKTSFRPMKATLAGRDTRSFFKLIVDCGDRPGGRLPHRRARMPAR